LARPTRDLVMDMRSPAGNPWRLRSPPARRAAPATFKQKKRDGPRRNVAHLRRQPEPVGVPEPACIFVRLMGAARDLRRAHAAVRAPGVPLSLRRQPALRRVPAHPFPRPLKRPVHFQPPSPRRQNPVFFVSIYKWYCYAGRRRARAPRFSHGPPMAGGLPPSRRCRAPGVPQLRQPRAARLANSQRIRETRIK
jgi:hypothetical protein